MRNFFARGPENLLVAFGYIKKHYNKTLAGPRAPKQIKGLLTLTIHALGGNWLKQTVRMLENKQSVKKPSYAMLKYLPIAL